MADVDPNLLRHCTPQQEAVLRAIAKHGGVRKAAKALGLNHSSLVKMRARVVRKASAAGYHPATDDTHPVAPGFHVRGTSKLYKDGIEEPLLTWVKTSADDEDKLAALQAALAEITAEAKGACGVAPAPEAPSSDDILAVYPVGDAHIGMLAWGRETGEDWDLARASAEIRRVAGLVVAAAPASTRALLIFLGDFLHTDDSTDATPAHGHKLDADSRYAKRVTVGLQLMRHLIDLARQKHQHVTVWVRQGNHDPHASVMLRAAVSALFEADDRVTISDEPGQFEVIQFGECLIGATHGHTIKAAKLPLLMATRYPEQWGSTRWRLWYTGHTHHDYAESFPGCTVEQTRIIAPKDAWAHASGYDADRGMHVDTWHVERGRIARHTEVVG